MNEEKKALLDEIIKKQWKLRQWCTVELAKKLPNIEEIKE